MDIKNHRVSGNSTLLPNQERLVAAIKEAAYSERRVFEPIDGFEGRAFLRDCCKSVDTKMPGVNKDLPAFKALRYCIDEFSPRVFSCVNDSLSATIAKLGGQIDFKVGVDIPPPLTAANSTRVTLATIVYSLGDLSEFCLFEDSYVYMGFEDNNSIERSNARLLTNANRANLSVKAINPRDQIVIDHLEQLVFNIGIAERMYFLVGPVGERNEPAIQLLLAIPTEYGQCMRKVCLSFHNDYTELVNKAPTPENVVAFKKD